MRCCMLVYDIPTHPSARIKPPTFLRAIGVRVNLSCWIIPHHLLPWDWIESVAQGGGVARCVRFDEDEAANIKATAIEVLRSDLVRMRHALDKMMAKARDQRLRLELLQEQQAHNGHAEQWRLECHANERYVKINHYRAKRFMRDAESAKLIFDITNELDDAMTALRDLIRLQQHEFFNFSSC